MLCLLDWLVVSSGHSAMVSDFVMALCSAVLDVWSHSNMWSPYLSKCITKYAFFGLVDDGLLQFALD